jgi:hypothetical protein
MLSLGTLKIRQKSLLAYQGRKNPFVGLVDEQNGEFPQIFRAILTK